MTLLHQAAQKAVEALRKNRPHVEGASTRFYDGVGGYKIRADAERCIESTDAAIAALESALQQQEVPREPELREAAKQFYNLTQGDPEVIIRPPSAEKRDAIIAAGQRLRAALTCQCGVECQDLRDGCRYRAASPSTTQQPQGELISDERILHLWDSYVGDPSAKYPLGDADKLQFARAVLRAAALAPSTTQQQEAGNRPYRTSAGDTLRGIAHRELGDAERWPEIKQLNIHAFDPESEGWSRPRAGTLLTLPAAPSTPESAEKDDAGGGGGNDGR